MPSGKVELLYVRQTFSNARKNSVDSVRLLHFTECKDIYSSVHWHRIRSYSISIAPYEAYTASYQNSASSRTKFVVYYCSVQQVSAQKWSWRASLGEVGEVRPATVTQLPTQLAIVAQNVHTQHLGFSFSSHFAIFLCSLMPILCHNCDVCHCWWYCV